LFGSCIIHILYTGCAKFKKNNSSAKGLTYPGRWTMKSTKHLETPGTTYPAIHHIRENLTNRTSVF